jgi:hypothetical protein
MAVQRALAFVGLAALLLVALQSYSAQSSISFVPVPGAPTMQLKSHTVGNMKLVVSNWGELGNAGEYDTYEWSCEFPAGSGEDYLFQGGLWIGGILGDDTLVSTGAANWYVENEFMPGCLPGDTIIERSSDTSSPYYDPEALSDQDFIAVYTDTVTDTQFVHPGHTPLGVKVDQQSYCWSNGYAKDFVIVKLSVQNIRGDAQVIRNACFGLFIDGDVTPVTSYGMCRRVAAEDDITGFRYWKDTSDTLWPPGTAYWRWNGTGYDSSDASGEGKYQSPCDMISLAWIADDDGSHPVVQCGNVDPALSATGMRLLYPPGESRSYNWWFPAELDSICWGPYHKEDPNDVRCPLGDHAKYRLMSNGYLDPDEVCSGLEHPPGVDSIGDPRQLLSVGLGDISPGDTLTVIFVYAGGEGFHNGNSWCEWSFEDLASNAGAAYAVYDNPGVDTDSDGYAGDFVIASGETTYVSGDGVPDFRIPDAWPPSMCGTPTGVAERSAGQRIPGFALMQNSPNPFSHSTRIACSVARKCHLRLDVYDMCGRHVVKLTDTEMLPGNYEYDWNGSDSDGKKVGSGVYFLKLESNGEVAARKMILMR